MEEKIISVAKALAEAIIPAHNSKDRKRQADLADKITVELLGFSAALMAEMTKPLFEEGLSPFANPTTDKEQESDHEPHDND